MTDAEIRDAAVTHMNAAIAHFEQTTVGYISTKSCPHKWTVPPAGTQWAAGLSEQQAALNLLAQIGTAKFDVGALEG